MDSRVARMIFYLGVRGNSLYLRRHIECPLLGIEIVVEESALGLLAWFRKFC